MQLPPPRRDSRVSVEKALRKRRTGYKFTKRPMSLAELAQLLWSAQGVTSSAGDRTAPSAGALFPLETYAAVGSVSGLAPGSYRYVPDRHEIVQVRAGDRRRQLAGASVGQRWMNHAPAIIIFSAVYKRTTGEYDRWGIRYVHMEVGHAAQNLALQAVALGMNTTMVGAFEDDKVKSLVGMSRQETPLYIVAIRR